MQIKEITSQLGNDIFGTIYCEHCGNVQKFTGYADNYYFTKVLPSFHCRVCGKNRAGEMKEVIYEA